MKIWFQNRRTKWKKQENISSQEAAEHKLNAEKNLLKNIKSKKTGDKLPETAEVKLEAGTLERAHNKDTSFKSENTLDIVNSEHQNENSRYKAEHKCEPFISEPLRESFNPEQARETDVHSRRPDKTSDTSVDCIVKETHTCTCKEENEPCDLSIGGAVGNGAEKDNDDDDVDDDDDPSDRFLTNGDVNGDQSSDNSADAVVTTFKPVGVVVPDS